MQYQVETGEPRLTIWTELENDGVFALYRSAVTARRLERPLTRRGQSG